MRRWLRSSLTGRYRWLSKSRLGCGKVGPTLLRKSPCASVGRLSALQSPPMDYRVELDVYNGPLDLLLYLIKRDELDISDIPIAKITDSYMVYVRQLKELHEKHGLDINVAGEFLVMAATLMEIKSAMLLPKPPVEAGSSNSVAELTDPRRELVKQLLEYKRFKDAASLLDQRRKEQEQRFPRHPAWENVAAEELPPIDLDEVQVWDLLAAFTRLLSEIGTRPKNVHEVFDDDTPIDLHAADIEDLLRRQKKLTLRGLILGRRSRSEMIGVFLALLELARQKKIVIHQDSMEGELEIEAAPPASLGNREGNQSERVVGDAHPTGADEMRPSP